MNAHDRVVRTEPPFSDPAVETGGSRLSKATEGCSAALRGRKILFYSDARHFGGHEVASLHVLEWMLDSGARVSFIFRKTNHPLKQRLEVLKKAHPTLELVSLSVPPVKYPDLSGVFYQTYLRELRACFTKALPDCVFVSQGNLAISWAGLRVARELKIPSLSYIPMAQPLRKLLGVKACLRDFLSRQVPKWPNVWLTCSEAQRNHLRHAGANQPIHILPNPISLPSIESRENARSANQLPHDAWVIGMTGRLNNRQKGCDLLVNALLAASADSPLKSAWLLFVGDGEARQSLQKKLEKAGWRGRMRFTGWTETPWDHYAALDLLVMPSRFEGRPLAMQEALLCHVPVCGTRVTGLVDYLPEEWLSPAGNAQALCCNMESMFHRADEFQPLLAAAANRVRVDNNISEFRRHLESIFEPLAAQSEKSTTLEKMLQ